MPPKKPENRIKEFFLSDEFVLSFSVLGGILFVALLCYHTPIKTFTVKPIEKFVVGKLGLGGGDGEHEPGRPWFGIYSLGDVMMNLGRPSEYLDSEIDLEYNGRVLSITSRGKVSDEKSAVRYLKREEAKLKDAIVVESSAINGRDVSNRQGVTDFKERMLLALNRHFGDEEVITNVYFKRFVLFSENLD